ncbi:histone deacetylase 4 isoform X2 [Neoarius graeffei]|nr:histone deacetylase 4 isoform X2 [Neoarius graeffei]XP_060776177.1 histone deacetylase 4 isoform X2 [Neoarius graeffei]
MASDEVKQKLQRYILSRRRFNQAKTQRDTAQGSELDRQDEDLNTPPSPQYRGKQLWRTASELVRKHKPERSSSSSRKDPLHSTQSVSSMDSVSSSRNSPACQCSPPSDQCYHTPALWDYRLQPLHQMDANPSFIGPLKMWIQSPVTVSHENMLSHFILLKHVYVDTSVFTSPHLTVLPGVHASVRQHRPLDRCQSQPLLLREQPSGFHERHSFRTPQRPSHTYKTIPPRLCGIPCEQRHPEAEKRTAAAWKGKASFVVGEDDSDELSYSSQPSPNTERRQHRPAFRIHNRPNQPVKHTLFPPPAYHLPGTADSAPDHAHSTGLVYDPQMLKQQCICGDSSCDAKHAGRIPKVFDRLQECGVSDQCKWIKGKQCSMEAVQVLHQNCSFASYGSSPPSPQQPPAVKMAAGCVTELVLLVAQGRIRNGFAIVQPHGHEASQSSPSKSEATFSPVAIAAKQLQKKHKNRKILILDWDVHHCNITQEMFYRDPDVLHISLHRYGNSAASGRPDEVGLDDGEGFNVNVEWLYDLDPPVGDAEYLAAFRTVIKPIAQEFSPDIILISTQFDTVDGHPASRGGPRVSAQCFGLLTQNLMELSGGRVVVVLERGHDVPAVCEASKACVNALLKKKIVFLSDDVLMKKPCAAAVQSLCRVLQIHSQYWTSVKTLKHTVAESWLQAKGKHSAHADTASALASLSMTTPNYTGPKIFAFCHRGTEPVEHDEDEILK